jgi:radical SAM-linked protein
MKVVFRFAKGEEARFLSHLDLMRTFERAFRRAGLPAKHSEGFNPRPKLVFADAIPVGVTSRAELAYIDLEEPASPAEFARVLGAALPPGLRLTEAWKLPPHSKEAWPAPRTRRLAIRFSSDQPGAPETISRNAESLGSAESVLVSRRKGDKVAEVDVRQGILEFSHERLPRGLEVCATLSLESPAPKFRELVEILASGTDRASIDWEAEKIA